MEITVRYNTVSPYNVTDIQHAISPVHDPKLVFQADYPTSVWDNRYENIQNQLTNMFRLLNMTIPILMQFGNWYAPHPVIEFSLNFLI